MDKDTKMSLIKGLLAGQLTKKQRRSYADLESVDRELKIQWNESENKAIDFKIKEQMLLLRSMYLYIQWTNSMYMLWSVK